MGTTFVILQQRILNLCCFGQIGDRKDAKRNVLNIPIKLGLTMSDNLQWPQMLQFKLIKFKYLIIILIIKVFYTNFWLKYCII